MRNRKWVWFFVALVALAAVAITWPIVANLNKLLKPEQLAEARLRWQAAGIENYDLAFVERIDNDPAGEEHLIRVRAGEVIEVLQRGQPVPLTGPDRNWKSYTVPGLFEKIERYLKEDEDGNRRKYVTAYFKPETGYPAYFVLSLRRPVERLEWKTSLHLVP